MRIRRWLPLLVIVGAWVFLPAPAYAYIDPATTTYLIQIGAALVITLGVALSVFVYRFKVIVVNLRTNLQMLATRFANRGNKGSDGRGGKTAHRGAGGATGAETTGKPAPYIYPANVLPPNPEPPTLPAGAVVLGANARKAQRSDGIPKGFIARLRYAWQDSRKYLKRVGLAAAVVGSAAFSFLIFTSVDIYLTNQGEMPCSLEELVGVFVGTALAITAGASLLLALLRGRIFDTLLSLIFALTLCMWIQGTFLNINYGAMTGDVIQFTEDLTILIPNLLLWLIVPVAVLLVRFFWRTTWSRTMVVVPLAIIVIQGVALLSMLPNYHAMTDKIAASEIQRTLTTEGIHDIGSEENVIVIILDRLDRRFVDRAVQFFPDMLNNLDGFTYYTNNTSVYVNTFPSVVEMFTAKRFYFETPQDEYMSNAYREGTFLKDIKAAGFSQKFYMEKGFTYGKASDIEDYASNMHDAPYKVDPLVTLRVFGQLAAYRYVPEVFKYYTLMDMNWLRYIIEPIPTEYGIPYATDDYKFYHDLLDDPLTVAGPAKNFAYYHLNGPHSPFTLDENLNKIKASTVNGAVERQMAGSMKICDEFLAQLKALGKYKDSTILILGDHGERVDMIRPDKPIVTALFYKPAGSEGTPLAYDNAPVSTDNFRASIINAIDPSLTGKYGQTYDTVPDDANVTRDFIFHGLQHTTFDATEYRITGDANDFANWHYERSIGINTIIAPWFKDW